MGPTNSSPHERAEERVSVGFNDVMSGRGAVTLMHPGNLLFRRLIREHKELYDKAPRNEKPIVAKKLVLTLKSHGLRFVKQRDSDNQWVRMGDFEIVKKVKQALREKPRPSSRTSEHKLPKGEVQAFRDGTLDGKGSQIHPFYPGEESSSMQSSMSGAESCSCETIIDTQHQPAGHSIIPSSFRQEPRVRGFADNREDIAPETFARTGNRTSITTPGSEHLLRLASPKKIETATDLRMSPPSWHQKSPRPVVQSSKMMLRRTQTSTALKQDEPSPRAEEHKKPSSSIRSDDLLPGFATFDEIPGSSTQQRGYLAVNQNHCHSLSPRKNTHLLFPDRAPDQLSPIEKRQEKLYESVLRALGY